MSFNKNGICVVFVGLSPKGAGDCKVFRPAMVVGGCRRDFRLDNYAPRIHIYFDRKMVMQQK